MRALTCEFRLCDGLLRFLKQRFSTIPDESSVIAVQIFDQRKFKRRDQGFLGVVNIRVSDVLDLELGGHGRCLSIPLPDLWALKPILL
jgi:hypothetical protein